MLSIRRYCLLTGFMALCAAVIGCGGPKRGEVTGQVTLDGQPIDGGDIRFLPDVGIPAQAKIIQGHYSIPAAKGPTLGTARVAVHWIRKTGRQLPAMAPAPAGTMIEETAEAVPDRYNTRSELTCEIAPGLNTFDLALTKASSPRP